MDPFELRDLRRDDARDLEALRRMASEVVAAGAMFVYEDVEEVLGYWLDPRGRCTVAQDERGVVAGTHVVKPNQAGRGGHVANAGYMVAEEFRGRGLGRRLGAHSLEVARALGYRAMQYNFVVASNRSALALWEGLGFRVVGTLPAAFRHDELGLVDAHVMYREL